MAATTTFTLRIRPEDHDLLTSLAKIRHQTVSDLARDIISEGIERLLDPDEIDRAVEKERERLKAAASAVQEARKELKEKQLQHAQAGGPGRRSD